MTTQPLLRYESPVQLFKTIVILVNGPIPRQQSESQHLLIFSFDCHHCFMSQPQTMVIPIVTLIALLRTPPEISTLIAVGDSFLPLLRLIVGIPSQPSCGSRILHLYLLSLVSSLFLHIMTQQFMVMMFMASIYMSGKILFYFMILIFLCFLSVVMHLRFIQHISNNVLWILYGLKILLSIMCFIKYLGRSQESIFSAQCSCARCPKLKEFELNVIKKRIM